jgi:hypothetical protein
VSKWTQALFGYRERFDLGVNALADSLRFGQRLLLLRWVQWFEGSLGILPKLMVSIEKRARVERRPWRYFENFASALYNRNHHSHFGSQPTGCRAFLSSVTTRLPGNRHHIQLPSAAPHQTSLAHSDPAAKAASESDRCAYISRWLCCWLLDHTRDP